MPGKSTRPGNLVPQPSLSIATRPAPVGARVAFHRESPARGIRHPLDAAAHDGDPPVRSAEWRQPVRPRHLGFARRRDSRGAAAARPGVEARSQHSRFVSHARCEARACAAPRTCETCRRSGARDLAGRAPGDRSAGGGPARAGDRRASATGTRACPTAGDDTGTATRRAREGRSTDRGATDDGSRRRARPAPGVASTSTATCADRAPGLARAAA